MPGTTTALALVRGLSHRRHEYDDQPEDQEYRVWVSPVGLLPWNWNGVRGEVFVTWLGLLVFLVAIVHWYWAALVVPQLWAVAGSAISKKDPFFPEVLFRLLAQPVGFLDC